MTQIHKDSRFVQTVAAALFLAACAYMGAGLLGDLRPGMETAVVRQVTVTDSVKLEGIAVRREQLICSRGGQILVEDGRRVGAGKAVAETRSEAVCAPASAVFYADFDGLEALTPDDLEGLTAGSLTELMNKAPSAPTDAIGRLVLGYEWYFAALAPADLALDREEYRLCFQGAEERVRARLISQSGPEEGQKVLLFRLTQGGREYLGLRRTEATLVLSEYTGLEVPEEAVVSDGENHFVYTLTAGDMEKKAVEILYTADGRCIAAVSRTESGLHAGHTVAISRRGYA